MTGAAATTTRGTSADSETLLRIEGLRIEAGVHGQSTQILKGVDLTLWRGEVVEVMGESGAGKSTLGLAAMGFIRNGCRATGGSVTFGGMDLLKVHEKEKRRIWGRRVAYVAQSAAASFNPAHTLIDQCCEASLVHRVMGKAASRAKAIELFGQLGLPDPERIGFRFPHQVSGGQLQRAMTAMALMCRPDFIVFDEPTTSLDVTTQIEVLAAIREIVRGHDTAAIYISHDLALVAQMADRVMVLRRGELVEEGPTADMLADPRHPYTKSLWAVRSLHKPGLPGEDVLLELRDVDAAYGGVKVIEGISLQVPRGRTVALVGELGAGKSTLARAIAGLVPSMNGEVFFDGVLLPPSLQDRPRELRRRIQMIYQSPDTALNPRRRVKDVLGRPLQLFHGLHGAMLRRRVEELLDMIELDSSYLQRLPGELSGGQKQRICIARALAAQPSLIICDEVTSALDQLLAEGILKLLIRLQVEIGISYLYISHDIGTVRAIADRIVVMHRGKIVQQGIKEEVLTPPHHPYTELLLSSVPEMDPSWLDSALAKRAALHAGSQPSPRSGDQSC